MKARRVHLDFHTSEKIGGIGEKFTKEGFQKALKDGHINAVTVFSKCHHGWAYHPSKANEIHPHLKFDLLKAQIEAAHEIGVDAPVYLSAGLDEKTAVRRHDWLCRKKGGDISWTPDFNQPGYHKLCFNTPYLDYLLAQIAEVCENYDADGIFLDIVNVEPCYCESCVKTLLSEGKDPENERDALDLAERVYANYTEKVRETVDKYKKGLPIFHNGGHIRHGRRDLAYMNRPRLELESLPTGGWGYDHFPMSAAYARTLGMEFLGMTGKFHGSWGEFGGFKHPNALKYEAALSAANGAACSVGDQLHPSGESDTATYKLIGEAYSMYEKAEPWLENAVNKADIAVISNEAVQNYYNTESAGVLKASDTGCARILLEGHYLFNVVDLEEDLSKYKLVILPDNIVLDIKLAEKFQNYLRNGGKILAAGASGLNVEKTGFALDFGCEYLGEGEYRPSYIRPKFELPEFCSAAFVMHENNYKVELTNGKTLAVNERPYFNRTAEHFCSHRNTPPSGEEYCPAMVENGNTVYISFDIFADYAKIGSIISKEVVKKAIETLIGDEKTLDVNLPAQGVATVTAQGGRANVHLLYASPVKRGENVEIIEDIIPIYDTTVKLMVDKRPNKVYFAPQMTEIDFKYENGADEFKVDRFECWQIVTAEF
jgi:hypothetical protein